MAKLNAKLEKRKFDDDMNNSCSRDCPFFTNYEACKLYDVNISGRQESDEDGYDNYYYTRCSFCLADIIPDSNTELLKLVKENNVMLKQLLNRR